MLPLNISNTMYNSTKCFYFKKTSLSSLPVLTASIVPNLQQFFNAVLSLTMPQKICRNKLRLDLYQFIIIYLSFLDDSSLVKKCSGDFWWVQSFCVQVTVIAVMTFSCRQICGGFYTFFDNFSNFPVKIFCSSKLCWQLSRLFKILHTIVYMKWSALFIL